jgi:aspartyl-tRNA(Asn)/glutamyl-tRNA(Gln) amidotransferase subunit C
MSARIDPETVSRLAHLAKFQLEPNDCAIVQSELSQILNYIQQIDELDLRGVQPFFGSSDHANRTRIDQVTAGLTREQALQNAPDSDGEYFRVPLVFG